MKRKYNTLNEEMDRMKSLFGESRLYGNLVDNEEKNILTEGYRFFDNLSDAFKLTFRSLDDLGKFTKFINVEINNVDDIVKHVRQFPGLWKTIASDVKNWDGILKNLEVLSGLQKSDKLKNIGTLDWYDSLAGYPQIGGMQDMIDDMWRVSKGEGSTVENLPAVIGTKKAVYDPEKGGIVIKTEKKVDYFDELGKKIDPETAKKGDQKLYDENGDEIDFSGKKVDVDSWEEGMIVFNDAGDEVGTYNKHGEIIDSEKNIVDKNGKIITKAENIPTDAEIVADGTPSQMDGNTYTDDNDNLKKVGESFGDAQQKDGGLIDEITNLNEKAFEERKMAFEERRMAHEERMQDKTLSADDKALKQRQMDLEEKRFAFEVKKYEDAKKTKRETNVVVTSENVDAVKKTFRERFGLTGKFFDFIFWPLSIKDGDNGLKRIAKQTGSAVVDPLGVLGWFQKFTPPNPKLVYAPKNVNWNRTFRGVFGTTFNVMLWNAILWKGFGNDDYRLEKILPTYGTNIKNNWVTQVGRLYLNWQFSEQFTEMCQELKESSGKDCNEWITGYGDDIEKHLKSYVDGKDCNALKAMRDSNGKLEREEYGKTANYITEEYNKEMRSHIGAGWLEDLLEWAMGWQTDITSLTADAFEKYEIDVTNGGGKTEKFNAIDYYFAQALMEKCGTEYQESQTPVKIKEVRVDGTAVGF